MKNVHYKVGMLVDHPNRPQWGPGKIVHVEATRVHVFFRDDLERKAKAIVRSVVSLSVAAAQSDGVLDGLPAAVCDHGSWLLPASYGQRAAQPATPNRKARSSVARQVPTAA